MKQLKIKNKILKNCVMEISEGEEREKGNRSNI